MTHELKKIFSAYEDALKKGIKTVLATVVALEGSSYRRPGVRMLILEDGTMIGAVSGGCVEKEVYRQALSVFKTDVAKVMTYDGRYRLGCEGLLYILLEPFEPSDAAVRSFWEVVEQRDEFLISSYYEREFREVNTFGSILRLKGEEFGVRKSFTASDGLETFEQKLEPCFRLVLIGTEHDAVQLCAMASLLGWEVTLIAHPGEEKSMSDFPGCHELVEMEPENFQLRVDLQTAVVLMTHSFVKDLQFLMALTDRQPTYIGILGPVKRREKLFNALLEQRPETSLEFIESVYGPAGLEIGAETPQEIALSVLAEIVAKVNHKSAISLREKSGSIHS